MPVMTIRVSLEALADGRTRMTTETTFPSPEAMDQLLQMGMEEGMKAAASQIDELLAGERQPR
jgi:uncharacterized protein YndB with AHSA1/START domain